MSNFIRMGDRTTAGGVVLEGVGSVSMDGRPLSFNGAQVYCPKCGSIGFAQSLPLGSATVSINGRQLLQAGDQCVCKCAPPALVASQGIASLNPGGSLQPYQYVPVPVSDDVEELAASTNKENFAARMLGYDRKTFGDMIHAMKYFYNLRGDDNVIWHDDGDVEFNGEIIDNMHNWAR